MQLSAPQARVVGSLIEKQLTTPQQYPLTLNALVSACNQTSNRDPVVAYAEDEVAVVLDQLKEQRLVRFVLPSHGRSVVRYRQVLDEAVGIDDTQLAVVAVLLLRGPQTVGELRIRTDRMANFESLGQVEHELDLLAALEPPLVLRQSRRPGQKEERWADLLAERTDPGVPPTGPATARTAGSAAAIPGSATEPAEGPFGEAPDPAPDRSAGGELADLRAEVARLAGDVAALRSELEALRSSLGG